MIEATRRIRGRPGGWRRRFEFQMLYGIRRDCSGSCRGFRLRLYVPRQGLVSVLHAAAGGTSGNILFLLRNLLRRDLFFFCAPRRRRPKLSSGPRSLIRSALLGIFRGKVGVGGGIMFGLLELLNWSIPADPCFYQYCPPRFPYNSPYTLLAGVWFLLCCGVLYAQHPGSALPLPRVLAEAADAHRNRVVEPHAAAGPPAYRIYLHLRPRHPQGAGAADLRA